MGWDLYDKGRIDNDRLLVFYIIEDLKWDNICARFSIFITTMKHKSEDYKIFAVKYYLKNKENIRKTCKIFDCKNLHYKDGYKYIKHLKILDEETENPHLIKLQNHK